MMKRFIVDDDITIAETLPGSFYSDQNIFDEIREKIFYKTWNWIGDHSLIPHQNSVHPFVLYERYIDDPLLICRNESGKLICLSNVCTHRGNILATHPGQMRDLICMYHGRRFSRDGEMKSMPEFEEAKNFPRSCDHLKSFSVDSLGPFLFMSFDPKFEFNQIKKVISERVGFLPLDHFKLDISSSKDYLVNCHWALYCDNYLEGFHIPFVHPDLNTLLDYKNYNTLTYDHLSLQIGHARGGEFTFDLPKRHPDEGKDIAAYYYWIFPNIMLNFYPWGLSVNVVKPINVNRTKVSFLTYIYDDSKFDNKASALLDKVEREDEFVVEGVHKGLKSHHYTTGRFSPKMEKGVHHFQRLLANYLN